MFSVIVVVPRTFHERIHLELHNVPTYLDFELFKMINFSILLDDLKFYPIYKSGSDCKIENIIKNIIDTNSYILLNLINTILYITNLSIVIYISYSCDILNPTMDQLVLR